MAANLARFLGYPEFPRVAHVASADLNGCIAMSCRRAADVPSVIAETEFSSDFLAI